MAGLSVSLVALLVVATVAWLVLRPDSYVAPAPDVARTGAQPTAAARTLQSFQQAVDRRDAGAARALAPRGDQQVQRLLTGVVDNAVALRVRDFTVRYVDEVSPVGDDGSWQAAVDMTWRFSGFDRGQVREEVTVGFRVAPGAEGPTTISSLGGGGTARTPLWLSGPLQVRRTADTLVAVAGTSAEAAAYSRRAQRAVPVVRRVLPGWRPRLVLEVPDSEQGLDSALGTPADTYDNIAAVTASVDGSLTPRSPLHVFVNPEVFGTLRGAGAQVVISHEVTHVAVVAPLSAMPVWLLEGFADYVALRDVDLPLSTTAGQIIEQVRRDGPPSRLPGPNQLDPAVPRLGAAYESAWLACRVLVQRSSEAQLVSLYRSVDAGADLPQALRRETGLSLGQLTKAWQDRLSDLAA